MSEPGTQEVRERLIAAMRSADYPTWMATVNEQLAATEGAEKAYWLRYRADLRRLFDPSQSVALVAADLDEARRLAPEDPENVATETLTRTLMTQQPSLLAGIPQTMRPVIREVLANNWRFCGNVAYLHWYRRRWYQSYRAFTRTMALLLSLPPVALKNNRGWMVSLRSMRVRAGIRCGRTQEVESDLAEARDLIRTRDYVSPLGLGLAEAEYAFVLGNYQTARSLMQTAIAQAHATAKSPVPFPPYAQAEYHLLAAQIARAEGNTTGFRHFCGLALEIYRSQNYPLSAKTVQAILEGAPY